MNETICATPQLTDDHIDLSIGEAHIIRENFLNAFDLKSHLFGHSLLGKSGEYPPAEGYKPLVTLLESQYDAPVIITNGAKQGLAAAFYAMRKMHKEKLGFKRPFWSLIPQLSGRMGLKCKAVTTGNIHEDYCDCYLAVAPNNPDGHIEPYEEFKYIADAHRSFGIPYIHDAAYYTPIYLPDSYPLGPIGDVQLYSISKMYGLSGLRIGYAVLYNREVYDYMRDYMEHMTVGVSMASQEVLYELLWNIKNHPAEHRKFVLQCRDDLYRAKFLAHTINSDVLEIPSDVENTVGMFLWAKLRNQEALTRSKINVCSGKGFGQPDFIRMNLAAPIDTLKAAIVRLNNAA
jgi:aspartate/methionine/tyrosine aminotransferase